MRVCDGHGDCEEVVFARVLQYLDLLLTWCYLNYLYSIVSRRKRLNALTASGISSIYQYPFVKTNYTEACNNFEKIYEEAISTREPVVVNREGAESVSVIPTSELNSIMQTAYLFQSPENVARLLDA